MDAPSRASRLAAKSAPFILLAVMLAGGFYRGAKRTAGWIAEARREPKPLILFVDECLRTLPPDARVILVPPDDGLIPAAEFYPRPVRLAPSLKEAASVARDEEWIVFFTDPP